MRRERILVVEDDTMFRELVALSLGDFCDVQGAITGADALRILRREPFAAMVLDYRLPDRTGLEVLADIRSANHGLAVIMMTGYGSESVCASALKLGIRDYFAKPFNLLELRRSVRQILSNENEDGDGARGDREREPWVAGPLPLQGDLAIQKAVVLIQQRYWDHLTLSGLAREAGISKYSLSHRFKQVMGVSLREYLLRVRLEKARALLATAPVSVTEVALAVGFGDLPRFDKLFKRSMGVTPSVYRDHARSQR